MPTEQHKKILGENTTEASKKSKLQKSIHLEVKHIPTNIKLKNLILKHYKDNFRLNTSCRQINPSKSEIGRVSKIISENINKNLLSQLKCNQSKSTNEVILGSPTSTKSRIASSCSWS